MTGFRPVFTREEDKLKEVAKQTVQEMTKTMPDIVKQATLDGFKENKGKLQEQLEEIKKKRDQQPTSPQNNIKCINCEPGHEHEHKMEQIDDYNIRCTGDGCGEEYVLIPKGATHRCTDCGTPIAKPPEGKKLKACPFCGNTSQARFDIGLEKLVARRKKYK